MAATIMETHNPVSPARWFAVDDSGESSLRVLSGLRIGETPDGELVINDPQPGTQWLEFRLDDDGALTVAVLADEWSLSIDGRMLVKQCTLLPGTCLIIGANTLWITDEPVAPAATEAQLRLVRESAPRPPLAAPERAPEQTAPERSPAPAPASAERAPKSKPKSSPEPKPKSTPKPEPDPDPDDTVRMTAHRPPRETPQPAPEPAAASGPGPAERIPDTDDTVRVTAPRPVREARSSDAPAPRSVSKPPSSPDSGPLSEPRVRSQPRPLPGPQPSPEPQPLSEAPRDVVQWKFTVTDEVGVAPLDMPLRANRESRTVEVARGSRWGRRAVLFLLAAVGVGAIWVAVERLAREPLVGGVADGGLTAWQQPAEAPAGVPEPRSADQPPADPGGWADDAAARTGAALQTGPAERTGAAERTGPAEELAVPVVPPIPVPRAEPELALAPASGPAALLPSRADADRAPREPPPVTRPVAEAAPASQPATAPPLSARAAGWLAQARRLLDQGYITVPVDENAVSLLEAVLAEAPRNAEALAMRAECAERLIDAALDARRYDLRYEARNTLEEVLAFDAGNQRASEIWQAWMREGW